ncbi:MAG: Reverse transcriptase (RNA-dependent DNA polymerase) [Candidatus Argoarchaeum ethanivorans]|uniref:Reverse transcriptase (RNA-dependent DNA polymerase) n=1 Tax=Candidatus Argoarchaeum ethanivorans TaxID=2608793 RepID=A0A811T539_9EURY|nr:MAG: Reverse transcriptase (RNA-dependent DNA polymerase) [Candidatus Argoarchaeum ethanivorans]
MVKPQLTGYAQLIRYADDFIVCFEKGAEARVFGDDLRRRLNEFGLTISEEKSKIIEFGRCACQEAENYGRKCETFDFLGFTHFCDKSRRGKFKLGRKTSRKKFRQKTKDMSLWLKRIRNLVELKEWWNMLRLKLPGHYRYYGMSGNFRWMQNFYQQVVKLAFKWVNRRSQRKSYNWAQFTRFILFNPLPKPKIYHSLYTLNP